MNCIKVTMTWRSWSSGPLGVGPIYPLDMRLVRADIRRGSHGGGVKRQWGNQQEAQLSLGWPTVLPHQTIYV